MLLNDKKTDKNRVDTTTYFFIYKRLKPTKLTDKTALVPRVIFIFIND